MISLDLQNSDKKSLVYKVFDGDITWLNIVVVDKHFFNQSLFLWV